MKRITLILCAALSALALTASAQTPDAQAFMRGVLACEPRALAAPLVGGRPLLERFGAKFSNSDMFGGNLNLATRDLGPSGDFPRGRAVLNPPIEVAPGLMVVAVNLAQDAGGGNEISVRLSAPWEAAAEALVQTYREDVRNSKTLTVRLDQLSFKTARYLQPGKDGNTSILVCQGAAVL